MLAGLEIEGGLCVVFAGYHHQFCGGILRDMKGTSC
jgi:hypothetical protein